MSKAATVGAATRLPLIDWTVTAGAPQLLARCEGHPQARRRDDFQAWKAALTALAGPPDSEKERSWPEAGQTRAFAVWERAERPAATRPTAWPGVRVNLAAQWDDITATGPAATEEG